MVKFPLPRIDKDKKLCELLLEYCRLREGEVWHDPEGKHKVGCLDVADTEKISELVSDAIPTIAIHDPPYNLVAFEQRSVEEFTDWSEKWIKLTHDLLADNASLYIWLGADQNSQFEPFGEFLIMMKESGFRSKSYITMRNQRGYGSQKNWMAIRQELLYYVKGKPFFDPAKVYTDIPKVVRGYYKDISGKKTENFERSKSAHIRAGNVWIDIQQVFYLLEENINGCFAQKPLKAIERILEVSSKPEDCVLDFFAHSGTTLLAAEKLKRKCYTFDINPVFCEISIRRIEKYRNFGETGWQNSNPFAEEILRNKELLTYLKEKYNITPPEEMKLK